MTKRSDIPDSRIDDEIVSRLEAVSRSLAPPWMVDSKVVDATNSALLESQPQSILDRQHLFFVPELSVPCQSEAYFDYLQRAQRRFLAAAYAINASVLTLVVGNVEGIRIFFGVDHSDDDDRAVVQQLLLGSFPGGRFTYRDGLDVTCVLPNDLAHCGIISGVPPQETSNSLDHLQLSVPLKSVFGNSFALAIHSRPIGQLKIRKALATAHELCDECHELTKLTLSRQETSGESNQKSTSRSTSSGTSKNVNIMAGAMLYGIGVGGGGGMGWTKQDTEGSTTTQGTTHQESKSLTYERQNSAALYLEGLAERLSERLVDGLTGGLWETSISLAADKAASLRILAGALLGEMAQPSQNSLPPRFFPLKETKAEASLPLPGEDNASTLYPRSLASYLTTQELARISCPPDESVPGYDLREVSPLSLNDGRTGETSCPGSAVSIGSICDRGRVLGGTHFRFSPMDLAKHVFVTGITGCGKTNTVKQILADLWRDGAERTPFLVIESAKRDYRNLAQIDVFKGNLAIFTVADSSSAPLLINPFFVLPWARLVSHIDFLKALFTASFSLYGPMPYILEHCLYEVYRKKGWDLHNGKHPLVDQEKWDDCGVSEYWEAFHPIFPRLTDLADEIERYVSEEVRYEGELRSNIIAALCARLESLAVGSKGAMFNSVSISDLDRLFKTPAILEMEGLADDDDKAFFLGLMIVLITEYRQKDTSQAAGTMQSDCGPLKHLLVIEEAHRLLKAVQTERTSEMLGNPRGKAVDFFANMLAEMRSSGEGVVVIEQIPSKLTPDVIKNTNAKIVHRLVVRDEQELMAGAIGLDQGKSKILNELPTGHALVHREGMSKPTEVLTAYSAPAEVTDAMVQHLFREQSWAEPKQEIDAALANRHLTWAAVKIGFRLINNICISDSPDDVPSYTTLARQELSTVIKSYGLSTDNPNVVEAVLARGIVTCLIRGAYHVSRQGYESLQKNLLAPDAWDGGSSDHGILDVLRDEFGCKEPLSHYGERVLCESSIAGAGNLNLLSDRDFLEKCLGSLLIGGKPPESLVELALSRMRGGSE